MGITKNTLQKFYIGGDTCIFELFLVSKRKECWKFSLHYLQSLHWYEVPTDNIFNFMKINIDNHYVLIKIICLNLLNRDTYIYYVFSDHKCAQCNGMTLICFCKPLPSCKHNFSNQAHAMVF